MRHYKLRRAERDDPFLCATTQRRKSTALIRISFCSRPGGLPYSVSAKIAMLDAPRSLLFSASYKTAMMMYGGMSEGTKDAMQTLEGLWWRHDPRVGGFVSFANTTAKTVSLTFQVIGSEGATLPPEPLSLPAHSTQMLDLDRLTQGLPGLENQAGGIRVQWHGRARDLAVSGGLENAREGFSTNMQFWAHELTEAPGPYTMAAVGMMAGEPDPGLGYPAGTHFTPYVVLRNSTSHPLGVKLVVHERSGTGSFPLPLVLLKPLETVRLDIDEGRGDARDVNMGGGLNLVLSYTGRTGDLVVDTGSVDHAGHFNMSVLAQQLDETLSQQSPFWTVGDGWDTLYLLWNWTDKAEDVVATFYSSDGSGHFKLPVHLEPHASATIDLARVIAGGQPDAEGHLIPARVGSGSAVFASSKGVTAPIRLGIYGVHFNVQLGVSDACCIDCSGYCGLCITPSPTVSVVGQSIQLYAQSYYSDGTLHDFTGSSTWSSNNTGISTVQTSGQANPGLLSGVGLGSCTITASRSLTAQGVHLVGCGGCPGLQVMTAYAQQTVATAGITVNPGPPPTPRSNQKSAGDGLTFPSTQSCSQYLGLQGCQYGWFWQSEIFARVPDDASKWTGSQIATGNFSGYEKDGTPFNHAINRNPDPITTQQTSGQRVIFWLDSPGIFNTDPNFDRGIYSLSLKSKVCESTTCACVNWHIKVVITTGQVLDTKNSEAGVDSYTCN